MWRNRGKESILPIVIPRKQKTRATHANKAFTGKEVAEDNEWNSDNELSSKDYSQHLINHGSESSNLDLDRKHDATVEAKVGKDVPATNFNLVPDNLEDVPPEVCSLLGLLSFFFYMHCTFVDCDIWFVVFYLLMCS